MLVVLKQQLEGDIKIVALTGSSEKTIVLSGGVKG